MSELARNSPQLQHLNLYGNSGVTDAAVDVLGTVATLREVYLWQTGVSLPNAFEAPRPVQRMLFSKLSRRSLV